LVLMAILTIPMAATAGQPSLAMLEEQFRELPMEAKRLTGPLFWLHGDETRERLEMYLQKVAESGNGCFTAEARPTPTGLAKAGTATSTSACRRRRSTT